MIIRYPIAIGLLIVAIRNVGPSCDKVPFLACLVNNLPQLISAFNLIVEVHLSREARELHYSL